VVSDTHGLARPQVLKALGGVSLILHAGDVGDRRVLEALNEIAPVIAVRGNVDTPERAGQLRLSEVVQIGLHQVYLLHDLSVLNIDPAAAGFGAVISGHSHRPALEWRSEVLYLNPGSAGPQRFHLPVSLAEILVEDHYPLQARLIELDL
jgi:putative phosphoesterase